ncbi:type II toxin-antitoxin system Phd/YefM family antitoxin [Streptomyces xiamenensis]|jgi:prevent-host-death family protein|uniref:type II toxin-antitoxin system Phd/YefM family antitoxin n=1 Tax=Streptomyces xiamenensis TaxID=408015 RepID=UPI0037D400FF
MNDAVSIREARAQLATLINRAEAGDATVITRNGAPVAALVPIHEYEALEDAADALLAREAVAHLRDETVSMGELLADLFGEEKGRETAAT